MSSRDGFCKHGIIARNCYSCHIDKTELDTLHETISELKVRVSKLEEYKRLQDDVNKDNKQDAMNLYEFYYKLNEHHKKQMDENRAVSRHFDRLDEEVKKLQDSPFGKSPTYAPLFARLEKAEQDIKYMMGDPSVQIHKPKTTGLTFDKAIKHFIQGKSIRYRDGMTKDVLYTPQNDVTYYFSFDFMQKDHWEVMEW